MKKKAILCGLFVMIAFVTCLVTEPERASKRRQSMLMKFATPIVVRDLKALLYKLSLDNSKVTSNTNQAPFYQGVPLDSLPRGLNLSGLAATLVHLEPKTNNCVLILLYGKRGWDMGIIVGGGAFSPQVGPESRLHTITNQVWIFE